MAYNHWRTAAKNYEALLIDRSIRDMNDRSDLEKYREFINELRSYTVKRIMNKEQIDPKLLLDRIDDFK